MRADACLTLGPGRVLLVEDDDILADGLGAFFAGRGFVVTRFDDYGSLAGRIDDIAAEVAIVDVMLPGRSGFEVMTLLQSRLGIPVIVLTGSADVKVAVEAMRLGAYEFQTKPCPPEALCSLVANAIDHHRTRHENDRLRSLLDDTMHSHGIVGSTPVMRELMKLIATVAPSDSAVLVRGETGAGKELVARAVHDASRRRDGPFVVANCAALTESLAESVMFGHRRGAFTGAVEDHTGLFARANGGTLFLDEVGSMPASIQGKVLRVLEDMLVQPLAASTAHKVDVRIVSATNCPLEAAIAAGTFRRDLFYRLKTVTLTVPPLRDRRNDIPMLVARFLELARSRLHATAEYVSADVMRTLMSYDWPGNVRELRAVVEHAAILTDGPTITALADELVPPAAMVTAATSSCDGATTFNLESYTKQRAAAVTNFDRLYFNVLLHHCRGNLTLASQISGVPYRTLQRRLKELDLDRRRYARAEALGPQPSVVPIAAIPVRHP